MNRGALKKYEELINQAAMFGMELDVESLKLEVPKKDETPVWLKRWRDKMREADINNYYDFDEPKRRD